MDAIPKFALEAITVQQCHEQLKIYLLAVVWRSRHEQEVAAEATEQLAEMVALGVLDFSSEVGGRHLVGLVADDEVPFSGFEFRLEVFVTRQVVEPSDQQVVVGEWIPASGRLDHVSVKDVEIELEFRPQLLLPLLHQAAGCHYETPF